MTAMLGDLLAAGTAAWLPDGSDTLFLMVMMALGAAVTGALPVFSSPIFEFSLNRVFLFAMFFFFPALPSFLFAASSFAAGALLRMALRQGNLLRYTISGAAIVLVLGLGPELLGELTQGTQRSVLLIYAIPLLLLLETTLNCLLCGDRGEAVTVSGRMLILYISTLPLALMLVILIYQSGRLGMAVGLTGFLGFSFIGRSISRKHDWNTLRISEISDQDRLATRLMESSSYGAFLDVLTRYLVGKADGEALALTRSSAEDGWVLMSSHDNRVLEKDEVRGGIPGRGEFNPDLRAGSHRGVALGLSDDRELVLLLTGPEGKALMKKPPGLLENMVLLLAHTWEAVGHSVRSERSFLAAAVMLARLADSKDDYTHGHSLRVANLSCALGRRLGLSPARMQTLRVAAILHDIGKLAIPASILTKRGLLTRREREIVEAHSMEGAKIVSGLSGYEEVARIIMSHHERLDGTGYPDGLSGEDIPFLARIVAVADTFDAITSDRSYHSISGSGKALDSIKAESGDRFDWRIVETLEQVLIEDREVMA
ncbi:MAG: hypothetical protein AVO35_02775 [Candidatus Aegiribacteria sp. MLS_C]|nr:MAG: hypothetical protein AVO35_02775 [Candidatus Aegiribacteria sp. MLS_C]